MTGSQLISLLFLIVCFIVLYMAFFYIRKNRFINTDDFAIFRDGFLSPVINFWLLKVFLIVGGLFMTYIGIQLIIREFG